MQESLGNAQTMVWMSRRRRLGSRKLQHQKNSGRLGLTTATTYSVLRSTRLELGAKPNWERPIRPPENCIRSAPSSITTARICTYASRKHTRAPVIPNFTPVSRPPSPSGRSMLVGRPLRSYPPSPPIILAVPAFLCPTVSTTIIQRG